MQTDELEQLFRWQTIMPNFGIGKSNGICTFIADIRTYTQNLVLKTVTVTYSND